MLDLQLPPTLWVPTRPAIVRACSLKEMPPLGMASGAVAAALLMDRSAVKSLTFQNSYNTPSGSNPYTFASVSIGSASSDRYVIVAWLAAQDAGVGFSSATIGGVSATTIVSNNQNGGHAAIFIANVTSGTTANIVVTLDGAITAGQQAIAVWTATGLSSTTAVNSGSDVANSGTQSVTLSTASGGFAVAGCVRGSGAGATTSWTNATSRFDRSPSIGEQSAADSTSTTGSNLTITSTNSAIDNSQNVTVAASW